MVDHPDFPQDYEKLPSLKYLVDQASKFEDASNCANGYYTSLSKIVNRLNVIDVELNKLRMVTAELKDVTDPNVKAIGNEIRTGLVFILDALAEDHASHLETVNFEVQTMLKQINSMQKQLDSHIKSVNERISPPTWKIFLYALITIIIGIIIGKWFL